MAKKLKFDKIVHFKNQVFLYPKTEREEKMFERLYRVSSKAVPIDKSMLYFQVKNVRDNQGNKIHEWSYKDYNQFREFFVQEVKTDLKAPLNSNFMDKRRPIFKDQPVVRPENFDQYWMNTPLQKSKQQESP